MFLHSQLSKQIDAIILNLHTSQSADLNINNPIIYYRNSASYSMNMRILSKTVLQIKEKPSRQEICYINILTDLLDGIQCPTELMNVSFCCSANTGMSTGKCYL